MDSRQSLNNREVAKAKAALKKIAERIEDSSNAAIRQLNALISKMEKSIAGDYGADLTPYLESFKSILVTLAEDNIEYAFDIAAEREGKDRNSLIWFLPLIMSERNYKKTASLYMEALSQEIEFYRRNKGNPFDLKIFLKEPISYIASHKWDLSGFKRTVSAIRSGMNYIVEKLIKPFAMNNAIDSQNKTLRQIWKSAGILYYQGFRNSDYYCPLCDGLCAEPHPIDDMVFPAHPRCVCGIYYINGEPIED